MDDQRLRDAISQAASATDGMDEPLRTAAFQTVLQWLLNQAAPNSTSAAAAGGIATKRPPETTAAPGPSVNEFMVSLAVSSHLDRIVAILYHNLRYADTDRMTSDEVLDTYGRLRERRPANLSDLIGKCSRKGHIIEASEKKDGKKAWQITPTGEGHIEKLLQAE